MQSTLRRHREGCDFITRATSHRSPQSASWVLTLGTFAHDVRVPWQVLLSISCGFRSRVLTDSVIQKGHYSLGLMYSQKPLLMTLFQ